MRAPGCTVCGPEAARPQACHRRRGPTWTCVLQMELHVLPVGGASEGLRADQGQRGQTGLCQPFLHRMPNRQTDRQTDDPASLPFLCVYLEMVQVTLMHLPGIFIKLPFSLRRVLSRPLGGAWKSLSDS